MNNESSGPKKPAESNEHEHKASGKPGSFSQDRADDPLFVPHFEASEITARSLEVNTDEYAVLLESICGVIDDSQPVEQYNGSLGVPAAFVAAHQSAVCQVQWNSNLASIYTNPGNVSGVRWGSGTMISNDLFLTCGHLFDQTGGGWERPRQNGTTNIITPQQIALNMHLNFNYQVDPAGNLRPEQSFPITQLIEYRLGGIDMALCRIGGNPGATFGTTRVSTTDAAVPEMICIIGHPAGQPKRIEAGPTTSIDGNFIRYNDIDTLGGNSGSGILRASNGRLVGVHTNGGCGPSSPAGGGSNYGQRIAAIIAVSPTLQALLSPKSKFSDDPIKPILDNVTLKFRDDLPKPIIDKPVVDTITLKFRDDVKNPGLDKQPGLEGKMPAFDNKTGFDNPGRFNPGGNLRETRAARPFILSTPHHSYAWQTGMQQWQGEQQQIEATLVQYEQALATAESELRQLDKEYRDLLAHYESIIQGGEK